MAETQSSDGGQQASGKLYTLSEVSSRTDISMPTLQRYKKMYQDRLPSVGKGRRQRYTEAALAVFEAIKQENVGRRGRPKKSEATAAPAAKRGAKAAAAKKSPPAKRAAATAPAAKKAAPAPKPAAKGAAGKKKPVAKTLGERAVAAAKSGLLTLTEIGERTKISYPTLMRYVKLYAKELPSEGKGRKRRFYPEAVEVFKRLRAESSRGGRKPAAGKRGKAAAPSILERGMAAGVAAGKKALGDASARVVALEKTVKQLEKKLERLLSGLAKSLR
jgi:hypothetical protein